MRFAFLALALVSQVSFAKTITCRRHVQDSSTIVRFVNVGKAMTVRLFVPAGETAGNWVTGKCKWDTGAIETSYSCGIFTSTDSGYNVRLFSIGGAQLYASVQSWTMTGNGPLQQLTCDKQ